VDGFHDFGLHGVDRQSRARLGALLQALAHLVAVGPVVEEVLGRFAFEDIETVQTVEKRSELDQAFELNILPLLKAVS